MEYDVFISCKSEDYHYAKEIYKFLCSKNIRTFLADTELRKKGNADYGEIIDEALESATHFILFASKIEYVNTPYIKSEWRTFIEEKRSGRKMGNIITILKDFNAISLPISLRHYQSFKFYDYNDIVDYLPKSTRISSTSEVNRIDLSLTKRPSLKIYNLILTRILAVRPMRLGIEHTIEKALGIDTSQVKFLVNNTPSILLETPNVMSVIKIKQEIEKLWHKYVSLEIKEEEYNDIENLLFDIFMYNAGPAKLHVIKYIKGFLKIDLVTAKKIIDNIPNPISTNLNYDVANKMMKDLNEMGATTIIQKSKIKDT